MFINVSVVCFLALATIASKGAAGDGAFKAQYLRLIQEHQQSSYQYQQSLQYRSSTFQGKVSSSKWQQQLSFKNYAAHSFFGIKNAWVGNKVFLDEAESAWSGSQKQLGKKVFPTGSFSHRPETFTECSFQACSYPTKTFYLEAKPREALDHAFQKALQQKKSPAEVRAMLEKEF